MDFGPALLLGFVIMAVMASLPQICELAKRSPPSDQGKTRKEVEMQQAHGRADFAKNASKELGRRRRG